MDETEFCFCSKGLVAPSTSFSKDLLISFRLNNGAVSVSLLGEQGDVGDFGGRLDKEPGFNIGLSDLCLNVDVLPSGLELPRLF